MKLFNRKENKKIYKIAFCDTCDISTKFSEYYVDYPTYEAAKMRSFLKMRDGEKPFKSIMATMQKLMAHG